MTPLRFKATGFFIAIVLCCAPAAFAEDFNWIMTSISKVGALDNGDGHEWTFRKSGGGWEVEGANFETANVTSAGENKVLIDGFPGGWGADGTYVFSTESGTCVLESQESATHRLEWKCPNLPHDSKNDSTRRVRSKEKLAPDSAVVAEMPRPSGLGRRGRKKWSRYLAARKHKAFARGPGKRFGWASGRSSVEKAKKTAIRRCEKKGDTCRIVSVDGELVAPTPVAKPAPAPAAKPAPAQVAKLAPTPVVQLKVSFADSAWNGEKIPDGQQCSKFWGKGATPALRVENIPAGANAIIVEFNDRDYPPLSDDGGHGKIGFWISEGSSSALLPSVPGETDSLPSGNFVEEPNQATDDYAAPGYLPPCSGGNDHAYFAEVKAVRKMKGAGKPTVLATTKIELGSY